MKISIIAAIGRNNELGADGKLLWNFPADMKHFRNMTTGHTVIMGRKTFESIGKALPNRRNIVVTQNKEYTAPDVDVVHSINEAFYVSQFDDHVFVIGGAEIYRQAMEFADELIITHINKTFHKADRFFPTIKNKQWEAYSSEAINKLVFTTYKRKKTTT